MIWWRSAGRRRVGGALIPAPPRMGIVDLLDEALSGILQRPGRSVLTAVGTILGVGAFVAVLGLTATAGGAINAHFDARAATEVTVEEVLIPGQEEPDPVFPADSDRLIAKVNGVTAGGVLAPVRLPESAAVVSTDLSTDQGGEPATVVAASPGALRAVHPVMASGRTFDDFHNDRQQPVALLGRSVAARLGITAVDQQPAIFVDQVALTVIGIIDDVLRRPDLLLAIVVPRQTAHHLWGTLPAAEPPKMIVETRLGAAQQVAHDVPFALRADALDRLRAVAPPDPRALRDEVTAEVDSLLLLLAIVALTVGAVGIANTTLVSVLERVGEIGLRRALGARPRHVAYQFLLESTALGTLGGLAGTSLGVTVVVVTAFIRQWTPLLEPGTTLAAPLVGSMVGLVAGLYPALRAAHISPTAALRR